MSYVNPIWVDAQKRRYQRHDWQRWVRHDAHRFLTPAGIAEEKRIREADAAARRDAQADAALREKEGEEVVRGFQHSEHAGLPQAFFKARARATLNS